MPLYDFHCGVCGHGYEEVVSLSDYDNPNTTCPRCGAMDRQVREVGAPAFKISGYSAANGYASKNRFGAGESEAGEPII